MREILEKTLDSISETLLLTDAEDLQGLAFVNSKFLEFTEACANELGAEAQKIALAAAELTEKIIFGDMPDKQTAFETLLNSVSTLQAILTRGGSFEGSSFSQIESEPKKTNGSSEGVVSAPAELLREFIDKSDEEFNRFETLIHEAQKSGSYADFKKITSFLHNLKGEAGFLGINELADLVRSVEHSLAGKRKLKNGKRLLEALAEMREIIAALNNGLIIAADIPQEPPSQEPAVASEEREEPEPIQKKTTDKPERTKSEPKINSLLADKALLSDFAAEAREHIEQAEKNLLILETESGDRAALDALMRSLHTIKGGAEFLNLSDIVLLSHETESLFEPARKNQAEISDEMLELALEAVDLLKEALGEVARSAANNARLREIEDIPSIVDRLKAYWNSGSSAAGVRGKTGGQTEGGGSSGGNGKEGNNGKRLLNDENISEYVKVDVDRIDLLVETIGELVISESMLYLDEEFQSKLPERIQRNFRQLNKVTSQLQELGMAMRMVSLRSTFQKMSRLVRDMTKKSGKKVQFVTSGAETEIDRSVVNLIGDPLIHMLRNAIDHGIEASPEIRLQLGKPETATISLKAYHEGSGIYLEVSDDGRGLDKEAILKKAIEKGLVSEEEELEDDEIYKLIFEAGFSTAKEVTDISGRGVGMDVVRRNVEELRGRIEVRSEPGKGSTFTIGLPLTLAIIDGMVINVAGERYIIPTHSIVEFVPATSEIIRSMTGKYEMLMFRDQFIPLYQLSKLFNVNGRQNSRTEESKEERGMAIVVEHGITRVALLVDELLGVQQTVIKSLSEGLEEIEGVGGASIMSDGRVGLIIDVAGILSLTQHSRQARRAMERALMQDEESGFEEKRYINKQP